jgi:hypothetical protein
MQSVTFRLAVVGLLGLCGSSAGGCTERGGARPDAGGGTEDVGSGDVDAGPHDAWLPDAPPAVCVDPIDLVFVLDVSTSMAEEATRLREGIGSIFAAADALTADHTFGLVVFVDDALVVGGCSSFPTAASLQTEFDHWRSFCSSNQNPGGSGGTNADCPENSLDAIHAAATMCTWRAGATHILIHVTDDTFEEPPYTYSSDFLGGGVRAVWHYSQVSDVLVANQIRVGAFAMEVPEECGAGRSDDTARGFFTPFFGLPSLPEATGGRVWDMADVRAGTLDMATSINEMIEDEHCHPF